MQDIFVFAFNRYVVYFNTGDGCYAFEPIKYRSFMPNTTVTSKVADLDQDGDLDIVVYGTTARVLTNTGFGELRVGNQFEIGMWSFELIDFDADGDLDIEGAESNPPSLTRMSNLFEPGCIADTTLDGDLDYNDVSLFLRLYHADRAAADVDGDGVLGPDDLVFYLESYTAGCNR